MNLTLVMAPTVEPLSIDEVKTHLRVEYDDENAYLHALINVAREFIDGKDGILGRAINTQTWKLSLTDFKSDIEIPLPPLQSISSIKYWNNASTPVLTTVATTVYEVITGTFRGKVCLLGDQSWPSDIDANRRFPVEITFVAGYGDEASDIPEGLRHAMLFHIAHMFENRRPRS